VSTRFDIDTAVRRVAEGVYEACIDPGWWVVEGPNGGYLAALLVRALADATGDPERAARSLTLHYTARPQEGPARIETRVERAGHAMTTLSCRLIQDDRLVVTGLAAFSRPRTRGLSLPAPAMPEVPPPESCPTTSGALEIHERFESRRALGAPPFSAGRDAHVGVWIRLAEPRALEAPLLALYADAIAPAIFATLEDRSQTSGIPTIDLTIHFREALAPASASARPEDEFVLAVFRTRLARDGFLEEDGEIWSRDGRLLAQSRQLALAR